MGQLKMMISMGAVALAGATAFGIGASVSSTPSMMSRGDYESLKVAITLEAQDLQMACDSQRGADRHLCQAETRAREQVLLAELEARYRGTFAAAREAGFTRVRAKYDVDRSKCFAYAGARRDNCVIAAHAERARALMAIKAEG
jgi:hypothetical protein